MEYHIQKATQAFKWNEVTYIRMYDFTRNSKIQSYIQNICSAEPYYSFFFLITFWRALSLVCSVWRLISDKAFSNWRVRLAFSLDFSSNLSCRHKHNQSTDNHSSPNLILEQWATSDIKSNRKPTQRNPLHCSDATPPLSLLHWPSTLDSAHQHHVVFCNTHITCISNRFKSLTCIEIQTLWYLVILYIGSDTKRKKIINTFYL